jgi:hypothetical protein
MYVYGNVNTGCGLSYICTYILYTFRIQGGNPQNTLSFMLLALSSIWGHACRNKKLINRNRQVKTDNIMLLDTLHSYFLDLINDIILVNESYSTDCL